MPLPRLEFEDEALGLPPQPIPIRLACLMADWTPSMLAGVISGVVNSHPPILRVLAFDVASRHVGEVHPSHYEKYRGSKDPLPSVLAALPANHFIWSDELVLAFSELVDLYMDRAYATETGMGIRWNPALGDCLEVVTESVDLSEVPRPHATLNLMHKAGDIWHIRFEGTEHHYKNQKGLEYLRFLLLHPGQPIPAATLNLEINASTPTSLRGDEEKFDGNEAGALQVVEEVDPTGAELVDQETIRQVTAALEKLKLEIESAKLSSDFDHREALEDEAEKLKNYLSGSTNKKGAPRLIPGTQEKIRKAISNALTRAIAEIESQQPALANHLNRHIKKGSRFSYTPPASVRWSPRPT